METYYLVDFENVHSEGMKNIYLLSTEDYVYIFYTKNSSNINLDIVFTHTTNVVGHKVSDGTESLDKHLVSYLGYLLGIDCNKKNKYIIVSKDKGFDRIIEFWKEKGFGNISRQECLPKPKGSQQTSSTSKSADNSKVTKEKAESEKFSGDKRCELNIYIQQELVNMGYTTETANTSCKCVIKHCNDERPLNGIHNELKKEFNDCEDLYKDVKKLFNGFVSKNKTVNNDQNSNNGKKLNNDKEAQIRSIFDSNLKKKTYVDNKEETIKIINNSKTRTEVNIKLLELYRNSQAVKSILGVFKPIIKDLPGK